LLKQRGNYSAHESCANIKEGLSGQAAELMTLDEVPDSLKFSKVQKIGLLWGGVNPNGTSQDYFKALSLRIQKELSDHGAAATTTADMSLDP